MKNLARFFGLASNKEEHALKEEEAEAIAVEAEAAQEAVQVEPAENRQDVLQLQIQEIVPNPFQPRKFFQDEALQDLAASIREFGVIQPLLVRRKENAYELIAGERRLRASKLAGLQEVPAVVRDLNDQEMAELAMIENLQREDLHFLEEAEGFYKLLQNFGFTQDALAKRMGKSQSTIANKLRLLRLGPAVREKLLEACLTERHARALLRLDTEALQFKALQGIVEKDLNVRQSELFIQEMLDEMTQEAQEKPHKRNVVHVVRDVRIFLNTIQQVVGEMKKSGLKVQVKQEQDDEYILVKMMIPKKKK